MSKKNGGHELINLATGQVITRNRVWLDPVTNLVIKAVEQMAMEQGIKNLKLEGRNKVPNIPANWISGVDYKKDYKDNKNDDEYVDEEQD